MNLHKQIINEGSIPSYFLILQNIIRDGKITDFYQTYTLSLLVDFFKNGPADIAFLELPQTIDSNATSTESIFKIKQLSDSDKVNLAEYLLDLLNKKTTPAGPAPADEWIRYVLRRQS